MATWPLQKNCPSFYGDPRVNNAAWQRDNLVLVVPPWKVYFDGKPVSGIQVHRKAAASLERVFAAIWKRLGKSQTEIDRVGLSRFSGSYNLRNIRGANALSMHAYGCAVDFDSANNSLGDTTPAMDRRVVEEFEREGWEWGGHWSRPDGMHFQAAWTRVSPPRLGVLTAQPKTSPRQIVTVSKKASFLTRLRTWFTSFGGAVGVTSAGMFTADNLSLVQGWSGVISSLGIAAAVIVIGVIAFWFITHVLLKMMAEDYDQGRYTPSGAVTEPELTNAMAGQPEPVV